MAVQEETDRSIYTEAAAYVRKHILSPPLLEKYNPMTSGITSGNERQVGITDFFVATNKQMNKYITTYRKFVRVVMQHKNSAVGFICMIVFVALYMFQMKLTTKKQEALHLVC